MHLPNGKFEGMTPQRTQTMRAIRGKDNRTTERKLRLGLVRACVRGWEVRPPGLAGNPDFFFSSQKRAVFVDGCFWHGCPKCGHVPRSNSSFWKAKIERNSHRDKKTTRKLRELGFDVVRFWEHELLHDLKKCIERLRSE